MKKIPIEYLIPGMILASDVVTANNQLIAGRETILTENLITRFEFYNIKTVEISTEEIMTQAATPAPIVDAPKDGYSEKVKQSEHFQNFTEQLETKTVALTDMLKAYAKPDTPLEVDFLYDNVMEILPPNATTIRIFDFIHNARQHSDSVYTHSLNVAIICNIMAKWLDFDDEKKKLITVAGLLHDIGKTQVPEEILTKPGKLTSIEFNVIRQHPEYSYNILKDRGLDSRIVEAAYEHHERCDGTGYPQKKKGYQLGEFSKIVAIADVYDAMTASRDYRNSTCPFKVVTLFEQEGLEKYDPHILLNFLERIVLSYLHNNVCLSDGRVGEVVMINKLSLSKPIVKIGEDFVDLSTTKDLTIDAIV